MADKPSPTVAKKSTTKKLLEPIQILFKRSKSANNSASQLNSSRIFAISAPSTHILGPGHNAGTAEIVGSISSGGYGALHEDAITPLRSSSVPDLPSSVAGQGKIATSRAGMPGNRPRNLQERDHKTTIPLTSSAEPASTDSDRKSTTNKHLGVALRFSQTLLKKLPDCLDTNPVKAAFFIAKAIVEIKNAIGDNRDELVQHIEQTANRLLAVERIITIGVPEPIEQEMEKLKRVLQGEIKKLEDLAHKSLVLRTLDHEEEKKEILQIFQRVNDATTSFRFEIANSIQMTVNAIHGDAKKAALERLCPSKKADHKTFIEDQALKREECTAGTRVEILEKIANWVNDDSLDAPRVFWLTGQAGSGKTTIAYTIAKLFEKENDTNQHAVLGGTFLCSRQYEETRSRALILPTIVYQLARKCKCYAEALYIADKFDVVKYDVSNQLKDLLVGPWQLSEATRSAELPPYLIVIDGLDEIKDKGGSAFLRDLLTTINKNDLRGLKFLVTSRSDPEIVELCQSFTSKAVCRLQDVPIKEAESDIKTYLEAKLPLLANKLELAKLMQQAGGLFIYAATAVRYLTLPGSLTFEEQIEMLNDLFSKSSEPVSPNNATYLIDQLYRQIMCETFSKFRGKILTRRLQILYTFLCTAERASPSIVAELILGSNDETAEAVLRDLHAVLYTKEGRVFWYHASFPDFIFDRARSDFWIGNEHFTFWCDEPAHHNLLAESCFRIMKSSLRFNIGNITSSFIMDDENSAELSEEINQNITAVMRYSCCHWAHHLPSSQLICPNNICCCISDFLQVCVLFWIEALNLLKLRKECTSTLQHACQWVLECGNENHYQALARDIGEAASFATYYFGSPAAESTPHLYISALATWSQETSLCWNWKKQFRRIPRYTQTVSSRLPLMTIQTDGMINSAAVSLDGARIVSGSSEKCLYVWDASTAMQLGVLHGHTDSVNSVAFSSDGARIVSGSRDKSVRVWDVSTGTQLEVLNGHTSWVTSVAFSSNGAQIVSGSFDASVRVWDSSMGTQLGVLHGHTDSVNSVAFSSDSARIVSGSYDKSVRVWDTSTGTQLEVLKGHTDSVSSVVFSGDGAQIVSGSHDESVRVWDVLTATQLQVLKGHTDWVSSVAFSSDGALIVSGSRDNSVRVWDASTGTQLEVLNGQTSRITSVAFASDGARVICSGTHGASVCMWDTSTCTQLEVLNGHTDLITSVAFSSDGAQIVSGSHDQSLCVWDTSTGMQLEVLNGHTDWVTSVAFSDDDAWIVSGSRDKSVRVWDASMGSQLEVLKGHTASVTSVAFSSNSARIVSGSNDNSVRVWDMSTGTQQVLKGHTSWVSSVAFSGDGTKIVSGSYDLSVRVWDASTGTQLDVLNGHTHWVHSVAFSIDGARIASGSDDEFVRVWDVSTGMQLEVLLCHAHSVTSVAFSSDRALIVTGSHDKHVRVWDASTGTLLEVLNGHTQLVSSVAFSSDSALIVSGAWDGSVRVWDTETYQELNDSNDSLTIDHEHLRWVWGSQNWITSSWSGNRLLWVPMTEVLFPHNSLLISRSGFATVDFDQSMIGSNWVRCYTP